MSISNNIALFPSIGFWLTLFTILPLINSITHVENPYESNGFAHVWFPGFLSKMIFFVNQYKTNIAITFTNCLWKQVRKPGSVHKTLVHVFLALISLPLTIHHISARSHIDMNLGTTFPLRGWHKCAPYHSTCTFFSL